MQRRTTRQKKVHKQDKMRERAALTMLPQEMLEHIYSFLANEELINLSMANCYLQDSIRIHELPSRALLYIEKRLTQAGEIDFSKKWAQKIDIQKDINLILRIANKIETNQKYLQHKTTASKASEKITQLTYTRTFLPRFVAVSMIYLLTMIGIFIIHVTRVSTAKNASSDDLIKNPHLFFYVDKGYLDLGKGYFSSAVIGAIIIGLSISLLVINELYKRFANDPTSLPEQIKTVTLEEKLCSQSTASFFAKKIKSPSQHDSVKADHSKKKPSGNI